MEAHSYVLVPSGKPVLNHSSKRLTYINTLSGHQLLISTEMKYITTSPRKMKTMHRAG